MAFRDRAEAGEYLAAKLTHYSDRPDVTVLGLPRGGVPVAFQVAKALGAPLDVFLVRKLGLPGHEEMAMGAVASGGVRVLNEDLVHAANLPSELIDAVTQRELQELKRRERTYRAGRPPIDVGGRTVILVDDGLATGSTMRAAAQALRRLHPERVIVAVPIGARDTCEQLQSEVDEVICAAVPEKFVAVGMWYDDFDQTSDAEVQELLAEASEWSDAHAR
jgi:predicted phosphoribosyltransferase